jgi:hypothetical protein
MRWIVGWVALAACSGGDGDGETTTETVGDTDTDTDTDTDSDTDADTDTDTDADTDTDMDTDTDPERVGVLSRVGVAVAGVDFVGTEDLIFIDGAYGTGEVLCQIRSTLTASGPRSDCPDCLFAFDLTVSDSLVLVDEGPCLSVTGFDASNVSSLDGRTIAYGYDADYVGHAQILMVNDGAGWAPATYCAYDETTGAVSYDWFDGTYAY